MSSSLPIGNPSIFRNSGLLSFTASSFKKCSRRASLLEKVWPRHSTAPSFLVLRSSLSCVMARQKLVEHNANLVRIPPFEELLHVVIKSFAEFFRRRGTPVREE